ncbi:MAG TPA: hypothetical protein DCE43_20815 [Planctomycetaceae bacterium]|nr:hypothetical protein [Planctomycetaceae bacterium]
MRLTSWIDSLRHRLSHSATRRKRRIASGPAERLEDRTLLSASTVWANGTLSVSATAGEAISVSTDSTSSVVVSIDGTNDDSLPVIPAGLVERIEINGGDGDNLINLVDVRAALFSFVDSSTGETLPIVINGGDGHDTITGSTDLDDVISGGNGDDVINGGDGNNQLDGGDGNDSLAAGDGDDVLIGEDGQDTLMGQAGMDTLDGGNGNDSLLGHEGSDSIDGGHGNDTIYGGDDNDLLNGNDGRDSISGGTGDDSLTGGIQADTLLGGGGDDTLLGNEGNDHLEGGTEDDLLVGGHNQDTLLGQDGNDKLNGQRHNDSMLGGRGDDTILGGHGSDYLRGNEDDDRLKGQGGNDTIIGRSGNDYLQGDTGRDLLDASQPVLTIDNVRIEPEGDTGQQLATFTVTLVGEALDGVSVDYATADGTAVAGADYTAVTDTLTWTSAGDQTISVAILGDTIDESDEENFFVNLANPVGALLYDNLGEARIVDDDDPPPAGFGPAVCNGGAVIGTTAPLGIGSGDASLAITSITADGGMHPLDAVYDPIGATNSATTVFRSYIAYRSGTTGPRTTLDAGTAQMIGDTTQVETNFVQDGLDMQLCQQVRPLLDASGAVQGALLAQTLQVINPGTTSANFELVRYLDGDLDFDGSLIDGGGRIVTPTGVEILFETDSGGSGTTDTTFVGITSVGGTTPTTDRWELDNYPSLTFDILAGSALTDSIYQDNDGDMFVDSGLEYDIELGLRNTFDLAPGAITEYTTHTLFGSGAPADVTPPSPPAPPPSPPPLSGTSGQGDTLNGGNGNDTLLGSEMGDVMRGGIAKDLILGNGGDDTILGQGGRDTIDGGEGNDEIHGNTGNDSVTGGAGDDHLVWSPGEANDTPSGGAGFDTLEIEGSSGDDSYTIRKTSGGGAKAQITNGSHTLTLGSSVEVITLTMGDGNDTVNIDTLKGVSGTLLAIYGEGGNDTLTANDVSIGTVRILLDGGDGDDTISGSAGDDSLYGGDGADLISGENGDDTVEAGLGDDLVYGNGGNDQIDGGDGNDTIEGNTGNDHLTGDFGDDSLTGGNDDDSLDGGAGDDKLNGQKGDDELSGGIGADTLTGGSGDDLLDGGLNDDRLLANDGDDTLRGDDGNDEIHGHGGDDLIGGGDGDDYITSDDGFDLINGGDGDDNINSGGDDDTIVGGDGNDTLFGGSGADVVLGEDGDDRVFGQGGVSDTLSGGEGSDVLVGLAGEIDDAFTVDASVRALLDSV